MLKKILSIFSAVAVVATADASVKLQCGKPDGYKTVAKAQLLGSEGKVEESPWVTVELAGDEMGRGKREEGI